MLHDFYLLETYYGAAESAQPLENLISLYGREAVQGHIVAGLLCCKVMGCLGSGLERKCLYWLSEKGRKAAQEVY